jgi:hypothetical protein
MLIRILSCHLLISSAVSVPCYLHSRVYNFSVMRILVPFFLTAPVVPIGILSHHLVYIFPYTCCLCMLLLSFTQVYPSDYDLNECEWFANSDWEGLTVQRSDSRQI